MRRWLRFARSAIDRTPLLLALPLGMFCLWACAADLYAAAVAAHYGGGLAVLGLIGFNVAFSWLLAFGILSLAHDLQELRLPKYRQVLAGALAVFFGLVFVAPCAFVWSVHGGEHDVLLVAMGSVVGAAAALLGRRRSREREAAGVRPGEATPGPTVSRQSSNPWRAARLALGPPYSPAPWRRRALELAALCMTLAAAPILVLLLGRSLRPQVFTLVWQAAQFVGFLLAIGLCWMWPLSRVGAVFNSPTGALNELALLPGLGGSRQQLRRLCLVALSLPTVALLLLALIALTLVAVEHLPNAAYTRLALIFVIIPLFTLPLLAGRTAKSRTLTGTATFLMTILVWTYSMFVWMGSWDKGFPLPALWRWSIIALVLAALLVPVAMTLHWLRKLLRRPHPFVEMV